LKISNYIKEGYSQETVKARKPIREFDGKKYTGKIIWKPCDLFGQSLREVKKPTFLKSFDQANLQVSSSQDLKKLKVLELTENLSKMQSFELKRLVSEYSSKTFSIETTLHFYKICIILAGEIYANKQIVNFLMRANVINRITSRRCKILGEMRTIASCRLLPNVEKK